MISKTAGAQCKYFLGQHRFEFEFLSLLSQVVLFAAGDCRCQLAAAPIAFEAIVTPPRVARALKRIGPVKSENVERGINFRLLVLSPKNF